MNCCVVCVCRALLGWGTTLILFKPENMLARVWVKMLLALMLVAVAVLKVAVAAARVVVVTTVVATLAKAQTRKRKLLGFFEDTPNLNVISCWFVCKTCCW